MRLLRDGGKTGMMKKKMSFVKSATQAIFILIAFLTISISIGYCVEKDRSSKSDKSNTKPQVGLANHRVINIVEDETPVSQKYFVSLMVDKDIKRLELNALLRHYMNNKISTRNSKKLLIYVYAYTDSLRYERGEQWIGMLQLNESQKATPIIRYDEENLIDGTLKKANNASVNDPLREKMFYDISTYDFEATLIMEAKYPMTVIEQITFMQNDSNRNRYLAEEESTQDKLIRYYMKKHSLTHAQFDALYVEGNQKNWTQKADEESEKIKLTYRSFM